LTKLQTWLKTRWDNIFYEFTSPSKVECVFFAVVLWFLGACFLTGRLRFDFPSAQIPNPLPVLRWLAFLTPAQPYVYGGFLIAMGYGFWRVAVDEDLEEDDDGK
jgi:hypothetical protein